MKLVPFSLILIGLMLLAPTGNPAKALCTDTAGVVANYETDLPVSYTYDPCDNWLTWIFHWHRNNTSQGSSTVLFQVIGCNVNQFYNSYDYRAGYQGTFSTQVYCGPSSSHTVKISRTGNSNNFEFMENTALYAAGAPNSPPQ